MFTDIWDYHHYFFIIFSSPQEELCSPAPAAAASLQSCPPGSTVPGILQARTMEWVAISFSIAWSEKWKWSR